MNRFRKSHRTFWPFRKLHLTFLAFIALIVAVFLGFSDISERTRNNQRESLETALKRDVIHCYALEGTYPPSLKYIKEHYGLIYDEDRFFVDYRPIGSNIMPDITIIER